MKIQWKFFAMLCLVLTLALASIAQTAAAPSSPTLSAAEREAALKSLHDTPDAFLKSIAGLSEKQWRFKPAPDRWSVAEVAEHIAVSESMIFGMVHDISCRARETCGGGGERRDHSDQGPGPQSQGAGAGIPEANQSLGDARRTHQSFRGQPQSHHGLC